MKGLPGKYEVLLSGGEVEFCQDQGFRLERSRKVQGRLWRDIKKAQEAREKRAAAALPECIKKADKSVAELEAVTEQQSVNLKHCSEQQRRFAAVKKRQIEMEAAHEQLKMRLLQSERRLEAATGAGTPAASSAPRVH